MFRRQLMRQSRFLSKSLQQNRIQQPLAQKSLHTQTISSRHAPSIAPQFWRRWQSSDSDQKPPPDGPSQPEQQSEEDPLKKEVEVKTREIIDLKDKYLRSVADFRNLQERTKRDVESARQFAIQRFATDLLDSIDNLDRALESVPQESLALDPDTTTSNTSSADPNQAASREAVEAIGSATTSPDPNPTRDLLNLHAGLRMTEEIMLSTLQKHGLERFDPLSGEGRKFDPRFDDATFYMKVEGKEDGEVFHTQSKGFTLNGRVIRPAKVGVVKNS